MGLLRQFRKNYGREPNFDELRTLGNQAKEIEQLDRGQVIPFPETRITNPFTPRPEPKMKPRKPETEAEMKARMERQNKEAVERLKKKKEKMKDDPEKMSGGGLAGFAGYQMDKQPGQPGPIGPTFETNDPKEALKEVLARMEGSGLLQAPLGGGFSFDTGIGSRRPIDAGISFNPQDPRFDFQAGIGVKDGKPSGGFQVRMPFKDGGMQTGIMSLEEGGPVDPSRRKFVKILGGLASIPILGKFIKPAVKVAQNPEVARRFSGVPAYFTKLVEKIKMFGDDAPGLTSVEREVGKKYKDYELVEDLSSGEIIVKRNKQGVSMMGDDMVEGTMQEEVMAFRPRKTTEDGIIPEEYEEVTVKPDMEGKMKEVEDGLDSLEDILLEVGERSNKAGGGLAYMLGE